MTNPKFPSLYQINTRVWLRRFDKAHKKARLTDVPDTYWDFLRDIGMDMLWLMGIWPTSEPGFSRNIYSEQDLRHYKSILPDLEERDVIGSPYAIDKYEINVELATESELKKIRQKLNKRGIKLILDFVPNHFGANTSLLDSNPEIFLQKAAEWETHFPDLVYKHPSHPNKVFAHGKDPYFGAWRDTIQLNYCHERTRKYMADQLQSIAGLCDGVRCDMTMIVLNRVFKESWDAFLTSEEKDNWQGEFWAETIYQVKENYPDFIFMAECYWHLEMEMLQLGFNYSYDKSWTDQVKAGDCENIRGYLSASPEYLKRTIHFLENHDEERIAKALPWYMQEAAALLLASMPGIHFYYQGQWEGRKIKLPVQLGREPDEYTCECLYTESGTIKNELINRFLNERIFRPVCKCTFTFSLQILRIFNHPVFKNGNWSPVVLESNEGFPLGSQAFAIRWSLANEGRIVMVNYSNEKIAGWLKLSNNDEDRQLNVKSLLSSKEFQRDSNGRAYISLEAYKYAVLQFKK